MSKSEHEKLISIRLTPKGVESYKSIRSLSWQDIPLFAVITGLNGSGKTQLLEAIAYRLMGAANPRTGTNIPLDITVHGDSFSQGEVAYIRTAGEFNIDSVLGIGELQSTKQQLYNQLQSNNVINNPQLRTRRERLQRLLGVVNLEELGPTKFAERLPDDWSFMLDETDAVHGLSYVFYGYRLKLAELREQNATPEEIAELGPAPWDVLNQSLKAAEFPYYVNSPMKTKLDQHFRFELIDYKSGKPINGADLSSGEKVILQLVLWLYNSTKYGRFPRLLILDEPDAHLHPSMTRQFIDVIQEVLINRFGVRIMMSTHSPSTVALAPMNSLFEMTREEPRIRRVVSKAHVIGQLTAGLVTVSEASRYVLVEDSDDVKFYNTIRELLTDFGPSIDPLALSPSPSIIFLPASSGSGVAKISGGKTVVTTWVDKFDVPPLSELIRGIIDKDGGNTASQRVFVLERYNIENYIADPILVFALLSEVGHAPATEGVKVSVGDLHLMRSFTSDQLNAVVDSIRKQVEPEIANISPDEKLQRTVKFTRGQEVKYPSWMLDRNGKELLPIYQSKFGDPKLISPPSLLRSMANVRLIPSELSTILKAIQA